MGSLWVARHLELDVEVALKWSHEEGLDGQREQRFRREARAAARLKSPHIVQIHDYGFHEEVPYIVMELLSGEDLGALLAREERLSLARALKWLWQAGKALRVVHRAGIVHRDIKPSNLFLAQHGGETVLKMLDFGIAKVPAEGGQTTSVGLILGSPAYMSPEQARGHAIDARSDLWSLAAVFYRMITGHAPFEGASPGDILVRVCTEDVPPPSERLPALGEATDAFFGRALARDPERRFASVDELLVAANELLPEARGEDVEETLGVEAVSPGPTLPGRMTPTASIRIPVVAEEGAFPDGAAEIDSEERRSSVERLPPVETTRPSPGGGKEKGRRARALWIAGGAVVLLVGIASFARGQWSANGEFGGDVDQPASVPSAVTAVDGHQERAAADVVPRVASSLAAGPARHVSEPMAETNEPKEHEENAGAPPAQAVRAEGEQQTSSSARAVPAPPKREPTGRASETQPSAFRADPVFGLPVSDR